MNDMRVHINTMYTQIDEIKGNVGSITATVQNTDNNLRALTETNLQIQRSLQQNTQDFREFVRGDLGSIIKAHLDHHTATQSSDHSSTAQQSNETGATSVFVPPTPQGQIQPRPLPTVQAPAPVALASSQANIKYPAASATASTAPALSVSTVPASNSVPAPAPDPVTETAPAPVSTPAPATSQVPAPILAADPLSAASLPSALPTDKLAAILETLVSGLDKKEKLTLPNLKKATKAAYKLWKQEALVSIELHPSFAQYLQRDINGYKSVSESIPTSLRTKLYMALSKCLDSEVKIDVGLNGSITDGYDILLRMEKRYGYKQTSELNRLTLVSSLDNTRKAPDERLSTYHLRFTNALEECRVNGVLPLPPKSIRILYMRNLRERCLMDIILGMGKDAMPEWTAISSIDELRDKVEEYLDERATLNDSMPSNKKKQSSGGGNNKPKDGQDKQTTGSDVAVVSEWTKRLRRIRNGLKDKTTDQQVAHLCNMVSQKEGGCYLHDHTTHKFMECAKIRSICEDLKCLPALTAAKTKVKAKAASNSSQPTNSKTSSDSTISARRVTAALKKQQDEFDIVNEKMEKREAALADQLEENKRMLKAMHVTMTSQVARTGVQPLWTQTDANPFAELEDDSEDEAGNENDADDEADNDTPADTADDSEDMMDRVAEDNSNTDIESYTNLPLTIPHRPNVIASCRRTTSHLPSTVSVVDSGATAHMDNDPDLFEYLTPVTTSDNKPVFVQQGDGSDLPI